MKSYKFDGWKWLIVRRSLSILQTTDLAKKRSWQSTYTLVPITKLKKIPYPFTLTIKFPKQIEPKKKKEKKKKEKKVSVHWEETDQSLNTEPRSSQSALICTQPYFTHEPYLCY